MLTLTNGVGAAPASAIINIGNVDFVRLAGGPAQIGVPDFSGNPPQTTQIKPGLLFGRDPITNSQIDAYIQEMHKQTHALLVEDSKTRLMHVVARGTQEGELEFIAVPGQPDLIISANVFAGKYVRVVPDANRIRRTSSTFMCDYPVTEMTWYEAIGYLAYKSHLTGQHWRLPTANEWEAAALAGRNPAQAQFGTASGTEEKLVKEAHFAMNSPTRVSTYPANPWGIRGMAGNVHQWTSTLYRRDGTSRMTCGGSYLSDSAKFLRAAYRSALEQSKSFDTVGFRAVIEPAQNAQP